MELIKPIIKVGNSAGVILPREFYGGKAKITIIESPISIERDIFGILTSHLNKIMGIYLVGSYARGEQRENSDIDVLVITSDINKKISEGKYNIILISKENVVKTLEKSIIPIWPMLLEARTIINPELLNELKNQKIKKTAYNWHLDTTKSSLSITKKLLNIKENKVSGNIVYPLILRLRELYIINSILHNKNASNKEFLNLLKKHSKNSKIAHNIYLLEKEDKKSSTLDIETANELYILAEEMLKKQENEIKKKSKEIN